MYNMRFSPYYDNIVPTVLEFKNETFYEPVRDFVVALLDHEKLHSNIPGSNVNHPHTFVVHPVRKESLDPTSEVAGILGVSIPWDSSLRNLLPSNVQGIHAIIKNNCNQSYTYEIDGVDAFFMGDGDLHEPEYEEYELVVDLTPHKEEAVKAPGHCMYTMVRLWSYHVPSWSINRSHYVFSFSTSILPAISKKRTTPIFPKFLRSV